MKKRSLVTLLFACIAIAVIPVIASTKNTKLPDVQVNNELIHAEQVDFVYKMAQRNNKKVSKETILNYLVTQKMLDTLFEQYNISLTADEENTIKNAFSDFNTNYNKALERGSQSEIDYYNSLKETIEHARESSGMSQEEFAQYNIEQTTHILKRSKLLHEKFNGNTSQLQQALQHLIDDGVINIAMEKSYPFEIYLEDIN